MKTKSNILPRVIPGFSCVQMKQDIQKKIFEETKGMSLEERMNYFNRKADRVLERFTRKKVEETQYALLAEPGIEYGTSCGN